jgi:hypothetical protein
MIAVDNVVRVSAKRTAEKISKQSKIVEHLVNENKVNVTPAMISTAVSSTSWVEATGGGTSFRRLFYDADLSLHFRFEPAPFRRSTCV